MLKTWLFLILVSAGMVMPACAEGGMPLWTNWYDGPGGGFDQANAIAADQSGNVVVTGQATAGNGAAFGTVKFSGAGVPIWTNIFFNGGGSAIAVNGSGEVFVTGYSVLTNSIYYTSLYTTLAYSSAGEPLWTNTYAYGDTPNYASAITLDTASNVVVTGSSYGGQSKYSFATVAYSSGGVALWTNRYNGGKPVELDAYGTAIASDTNGNVFVTGYSMGGSGIAGFDFTTIKYSGTGLPLWTNRYDGGGNSDDYASAIALDRSGNVFVTGYSKNSSGNFDYATIAYSNAGSPLWTNRYNGEANGDDFGRAIAVDAKGNVFVTGYSTNSGSDFDYLTIAYSNIGLPLWTNRYNGAENGYDRAVAIALDSGGNVFVTGYSTNSTSVFSYATVAYSNAGLPLWTNSFTGGTYAKATALTVDAGDNVFVTGYSEIGSGGQNYTTIKYSSILTPPVYLGFQLSGNQLLLNWTNSGFHLQSAPAATGTFTNIPGAVSPYTNQSSDPQGFFRLILN